MLQIDYSVKFRAFGITFGTLKDTYKFLLPANLSIVGLLVGPKQIHAYNQHGVNILVSLIPSGNLS